VPLSTDIREAVSPGKTIRCVLAYDHVLLREGLRRLLEAEPDVAVVAEAGNAAECLRKVHELQPDILVAGPGTFELPAPEVELCVARESPQTKVVFVSALERNDSQRTEAWAATGDCAFRHTSAQDFVRMVRNSSGVSTNPEPLSMRRAPQRQAATFSSEDRILTPREREVLKLLAEGKTVRVAATILGLSSKTVDAHKFNLMRKLGIHNKAELVMWAIRQKVVKIPVNF
jgi:two-component system response regulator NreC